LGIIALLHIRKKQIIDWKRLSIGIFLPSIAILLWQFFLTFGSFKESGLSFAPFSVMLGYASPPFAQISELIRQSIYKIIYLPSKFILSIVFPVVVIFVFWKDSFKDIKMQIGWIGFGMGAIYT
jgi:hypothetical protein